MKVINLTPHDVVLQNNGKEKVFTASGSVARVLVEQTEVGDLLGFPVKEQEFGDIENLPEAQEGVRYIVSLIVLEAAKEKGRTDCVAPDTSNAIRNEKGHIVAVPGFIK